jgi:hypothetical protein
MTDGTVTTSSNTAELENPGLTQIQRILYTFTAPSKTFADILRNTSWWLPFLLSVVLSYAFIFTMQSRVGWDKLTENAMKQNPKAAEQMASMPADQRAQTMKITMIVTKVITYSVPLIGLLFAALAALVLWGTINFGFGGNSTFGQVFAVWIYGTLPLVLQGILGTITMFAGMDPDSFNPQNPVGSNIGYYLSNETPKWLSTFATSIDVFWIWAMILVSIGLAIVAKVKRSAGLTAVFGWWLLILIVRMGIDAVRS